MHNIVLTTVISAHFETLLVKLGAKGKGLHEKTTSVEVALPPNVVRLLRKIGSIRNDTHHNSDSSFDEEQFIKDALALAKLMPSNIVMCKPNPNVAASPPPPPPPPLPEIVLEQKLEPVLDSTIAALLEAHKPDFSDEQLEERIDRANEVAMAVWYPSYERWDSFLYLAKEESDTDQERIHNLGLALLAGCEVTTLTVLARRILSDDFLRNTPLSNQSQPMLNGNELSAIS